MTTDTTRRLLAVLIVGVMCLAGSARADQTDPRLESLLEALAETDDPMEIEDLENRIERIWHDPGSPSIDLLMTRGMAAREAGQYETALQHFTDVVELAPDYAEGWNQRATVYFLMDRYDEAVLDIERTVTLEPRHYGAWSGLGLIFMEIGNEQGALAAYRKALAINPHLNSAATAVKRLAPDVEGQGI